MTILTTVQAIINQQTPLGTRMEPILFNILILVRNRRILKTSREIQQHVMFILSGSLVTEIKQCVQR
jgi:hypothetical protein